MIIIYVKRAQLHAAAVIFDFIVFAHNMFFISKCFFHFMFIASLISTYYYNDVYLHISCTDHRQNNTYCTTLVKCIILLPSWHDRARRFSPKRSERIYLRFILEQPLFMANIIALFLYYYNIVQEVPTHPLF